MKQKKPDFGKLEEMLKKIHEDPELMEIAKNFVRRHGGRIPV